MTNTICCCCPFAKKEESSLESPLITDGPSAKFINFAVLYVPELDSIFSDFERALNPFVENRIALEKTQRSFKMAVESIERIDPKAAFKEYVKVLRTSLAGKDIFVKIERGVVKFEGEAARIDAAERKVEDAIQKILSTADDLHNMIPSITRASEDALQRAESLDIKAIVQRECAGVKEALTAGKKFKDNLKLMRKAPKMVADFCKEVEKIVKELMQAFDGETGQQKESDRAGRKHHAAEGRAEEREGSQNCSSSPQKKNEDSKDGKNNHKSNDKNAAKNEKKDGNKTEKFQKAIRFEKIDIPDIDRLFTEFASTVNPFVTSRENMQKARNSFETVFKAISDYDAEKELKAYLKEFKKKAKINNLHIYIDLVDRRIQISANAEIPVPKLYQDAVRFLNDMKTCASAILDLEPEIHRGIESISNDILNVKPESDLRRALKLRELPKLPTKLKKFNNNRKIAQEAPEIVSDFFKYIKQVLSDIREFAEAD